MDDSSKCCLFVNVIVVDDAGADLVRRVNEGISTRLTKLFNK